MSPAESVKVAAPSAEAQAELTLQLRLIKPKLSQIGANACHLHLTLQILSLEVAHADTAMKSSLLSWLRFMWQEPACESGNLAAWHALPELWSMSLQMLTLHCQLKP